MIFLVACSIGTFVLLFIRKERKPTVYMICLVPLLLSVFNIDNPDKVNYLTWYQRIQQNGFAGITLQSEFGLQILMLVAQWFHIDAELFFDIYYIIAFGLLIRFAEKWSDKPAVVLGMYCIFPLFLDIVQIRSMMAGMIFLNSIGYLMRFTWKNFFKYLLCVFLAFSIHYSAVFFLLFLLAYLPLNTLIYVVSVMLITVVLLSNDFIFDKLGLILPIVVEKIERYRNNSISSLSMIGLLIIFALNISIVLVCLKYAHKRGLLEQGKALVILKLNIISLFLVMVSITNMEFMRLYRPIAIMNYSIMGGMAAYNRRTHSYRVKPILYAILIMVGGWVLCYRFTIVDHYEDVIECILSENYIVQ